MFSKRRNEYLAGGLLLALVAAAVGSIATSPIGIDSFRTGAMNVLEDIDGHRNLFFIGTSLDIVSNFVGVALAVMLYAVFRRHEGTLAILGTVGFLTAGIVFLVGDMLLLSLGSLSQQFFAASGAQADYVLASAGAITPMLDTAFPMGATAMGIGVFCYGLLVVVTGAIPRWIGAVAILAGIVAPFGWLLFANGELVLISFIGLLIALLFALFSGLWLIIRGTTEAAA
ncbi:MAG: DUF4386 domain-containing protein [Chloroflexi bacterium]|nr:DUF4386 domain-containing protein [Chloroflexota bacterium]